MQFDQLKRRGFIMLFGRAVAWALNSALLSLGIAVSWPAAIKAHDIYTALKDSSGRSCCSDHDCRPGAALEQFTKIAARLGRYERGMT
jgi:hypothetical protein